ncbi:MAG TPA: hypothetical protein ENJ87_03640 [Gammaproteobacteria bacterium]|nr:hypothetical protein [Gammaproteobacteria bacterium]
MATDDEKITRLYQQGKKPGPPARLDKVILAAAHEATEDHDETASSAHSPARPTVIKGPFSGGLPALLSVAAVLIISIILVPLIEQTSSTTPTDSLTQEPASSFDKAIEQVDDGGKASLREQRTAIKTRSITEKKRLQTDKKKQPHTWRRSQPQAPAALKEAEAMRPAALKPNRVQALEQRSAAKKTTPLYLFSSGISKSPEANTSRAPMLEQDNLLAGDAAEPRLKPAQWLKKIQLLIDLDDLETARRELETFMLQYPDEDIDQAIKDVLE